ncbi:hypothetical protein [Ekhidna sp.]|uniref:hypothetical protein n=1 Tax=Ekhidna sp. TaxID=2608089 RepID=UPI003298D0AA
MKHFQIEKLVLSIFLLATSIACQEDALLETQIEETDHDMLAAVSMADEYLNSLRGKSENTERSITVLRFYKDRLYFNTNTDTIRGYRELTETSITAIVEPGEFIFWYSGGGVTDLDGIEFDPSSQNDLDEFPEEINEDKMWKIQVPQDGNLPMYKYDILYDHKGNSGSPIRLDPKIRIQGNGDA